MSKVKGEPRTKQNALHLTSLPNVGENLLKQPFKNRPRTTVRGLEGNLEYGTP